MENYGVSKAALATYYKVNKKLETLVFIVYINNTSNYCKPATFHWFAQIEKNLGVCMDSLDPTHPSNPIGPNNVLKQEYTNCHIRYKYECIVWESKVQN